MIETYTMKEVMAILRVSRDAIKRYIASGKIKAIKLGKIYRFSKQEIDNLIKGVK